jgi:hypothetical protein
MLPFPPPLAGEGQGGGSRRDGGSDGFEYASAIRHHIVVAEAEDLKSLCFNDRRSFRVSSFALVREVLTAVELDNEFRSVTNKVGDIIFDRDLATKASTAQAVVAQFGPKDSFDVS